MKIQEYRETENQQEWDDFISSHPQGRITQLIGFKKALESTHCYQSSYFLFKESDSLIGVLPCFLKKSIFDKTKLISLPFSEYGGLLGKNISKDEMEEIVGKLKEKMLDMNVSALEIRGGLGLNSDFMDSYFQKNEMGEYAQLRLTTAEEIWKNQVSPEVRKAVRKARRSKLKVYEETTKEAIQRKFYPLYLISMKRLGTPPHSMKLFLNYLGFLNRYIKLFLVNYKDHAIARLLGFAMGGRIHITFTVCDSSYWSMRPNDLAHWAFIEWGCKNGYKIFDFGLARYEGQKRFKEKWGVDFCHYNYYFLSTSTNDSSCTTSTVLSNSKLKILSNLWSKFVPTKIGRFIGPCLRKQLGR